MVCPVCTLAVAGGIGILESWGVDSAIIGIWLGALIVSLIAWTIDWFNRKNIHFLFRKILIIIFYYAITIWPLYHWGYMGGENPVIFGMDRIFFGVILGTILFILAVLSDIYLRKINEDIVMIKYQKVLIPLAYLIIASIILFLLIGIFAW